MILILLLVVLVLLNFLDGLTTYLNLFKIPTGLGGEEANPLFHSIDKRFRSSMIIKGVWTLAVVFILLLLKAGFLTLVVDIAFVLVVINNSYIYLYKAKLKRRPMTPIKLISNLINRTGLKESISKVIAFYIFVAILIYASWKIALALVG